MANHDRHVEFWFDFASTYSYFAIQRIEAEAAIAGIDVIWRPFLLGPIFAAQGWNDSPFNIYPAKGRFMMRDLARRAAAYGLPFDERGELPANSVPAARLAYAALQGPKGPAFCRNVSAALWAEARKIADPDVLADCARAADLDPEALTELAASDAIKPLLRDATAKAQSKGVFGAPSFTVGDELFWGEDQMADALAWAATGEMATRG